VTVSVVIDDFARHNGHKLTDVDNTISVQVVINLNTHFALVISLGRKCGFFIN